MTPPDRPPDVVACRRVHDGWVGLRVDTLRYASGREGTIEDYIFLRHPFAQGVVRNSYTNRLPGFPPETAIPLSGTGRCQLNACMAVRRNIDLQHITAGYAAGRMNDHDLADFVSFRIERSLNQQRTTVTASREPGAFCSTGKVQFKSCMPSTAVQCFRRFHTDKKLRTSSASIDFPNPLFTTSPRRRTR